MALSEASPLSYDAVLRTVSTDGVANVFLTSGIAQQVTVPLGARACVFNFNADFWVTFGASTAGAISPSSYSSAGSTASAVFNPTRRYIPSTTAINIYSDYTCRGSVAFYK